MVLHPPRNGLSLCAGAGRREPTADQRGWDTVDRRGASLRRGDGAAGPDRASADSQGDQRELDHTAGARCDGARERPEADERGGQRLSGAGCSILADASKPGPQGRECARTPGEWDRAQAHGSASELCGTWLFPPGPADRDAWGTVLRADPTRAPAFARRDAKAAALDLASLFTPEQAQAIEQRAGSMEIGDILRSVGEEAPGLVDQAEAFVTWLMGWPRGHALCASSVTAWSRWKLHMRGALSRLPSASAGWIWEPPKPKQKEKPREQLSLF